MSRYPFLLLAVLFVLHACGDKEKETPPKPVAQMRLNAQADLSRDFFAQPFPLESRRSAAGTYDLSGFPNPVSYALIEYYKTELAKGIDGYGTTSGVYMEFSGALDFADAITGEAASAAGESSVLLVNVDPDSPDYLSYTPVWTRFFRGDSKFLPVNTLALVPMPGFPLRGDTAYAAIVTVEYGLRGLEGPLRQAGTLRQALNGEGAFAEAYAPLVDALPELGLSKEKIVGATVYRTMDFSAPLFAARDWLHAEEVTGSARITEDYSGYSARHLHGVFESIQFQHGGEPPFDEPGTGGIRLDDSGVPVPAATKELRFALQLPDGDAPANGWPLVVYAHGTGGDYHSAIGWTSRDEGHQLAEQGIALVGYDQPYHGTRNSRVEPCDGTCPQLYTFNFLNPAAARDGFRQSALDAVQLMRAMLAAEFKTQNDGRTHRFDPDRVYYMGHSQGSTSGPMFVAAEDKVKAAVFSGPAGGLTLTFLYKTEPLDIPAVLSFLFGDQEGFDIFHPVTNLFQAYMEPIDPMNYGPLMARRPRSKDIVRDILATEGLTDEYTPAIQAEAFAIASGLQPVMPFFQDLTGGFDIAGLEPARPDLQGNLENEFGNEWTGGLLQFPDTGHFSIYCQSSASDSYAKFLASKAAGSGAPALIADYGTREWKDGEATDIGCTESSATAAPRGVVHD